MKKLIHKDIKRIISDISMLFCGIGKTKEGEFHQLIKWQALSGEFGEGYLCWGTEIPDDKYIQLFEMDSKGNLQEVSFADINIYRWCPETEEEKERRHKQWLAGGRDDFIDRDLASQLSFGMCNI